MRVIDQHLASFSADQRGNIAIMFAATLTSCVALGALAVDLGSLFVERRQAQGVVDLAALAAAADIENAERAANATLAANAVKGRPILSVTRGHYTADIGIAPQNRFKPNVTPFNAVSVRLVKNGTTFFSTMSSKMPPEITTSAIGTTDAQVAFSVGSRLASIHDGIPNAVLGALVGGNVSLSVMEYEALVSGNVSLMSFFRALAGEAQVSAATYDDVLHANVSLVQVFKALADVCISNGQLTTAVVLTELARTTSASLLLTLDKVINLGPAGSLTLGTASPGLLTTVDVLGLVTGAATVANGQQQLTLALGATIPGLTKVTVTLAIGEPMQNSGWVSLGQPGAELHTAQTRIRIVAEIGGAGVLSGATIRLPIAIDVASAAARLDAYSCGSDATATIGVVPGIVDAWIGETSNLATWPSALSVWPANIVTTPLVKITGGAHLSAGELTEEQLVFDQSDVAGGKVKTADSSQIIASLASSLVRNSSLTVNALGLSLSTPEALQAATANALATAAVPLDDVIHGILEALGVHLGEADVRVYGIRCQGAVLGG